MRDFMHCRQHGTGLADGFTHLGYRTHATHLGIALVARRLACSSLFRAQAADIGAWRQGPCRRMGGSGEVKEKAWTVSSSPF
jgi:hypothetical protein